MIRQASLLALVLALGACADKPDPMATPASSEQAEAAEGRENEAMEGNEAEDADEADEAVTPPAAVASAFQSGHAGATGLTWSRESDGGYEASYTEGGRKMSTVYAADGMPGEVETEMAVSDLPAAVTATLARDYAGKSVTGAARIVKGGKTTYEAEITEGGTPRDLVFNEDGSLVAPMGAN